MWPDIMSKELLGKDAEKMTKMIMDSCFNKNGKYTLTKSQIRKFYSEFKKLESKIDKKSPISDDIYGQIKLIKAKAIYNTARKSAALPKKFSQFIEYCVDTIKSDDPENAVKFVRVCNLFEAFVGYSSEHQLNL